MRVRFLNGLRGIASLIVVFDHIAISFFPAAVDIDAPAHHSSLEWLVERTPLHLLVAGNFSVCIFFVLSGFVLSTKFFETKKNSVVVAMAIKRYFRLALSILASVLLAYGLIRLHLFKNVELSGQTGSLWLLRFWRTMPSFFGTLYHGLVGVFISGKSDEFNTVLWTMRLELIGSFMVFAVLLAFGKSRFRATLYILLGILLVKSYLVAFLAGVVLSDYYVSASGKGTLSRLLSKGWWVLPLVVGLYLGSSPVDSLRSTPFQHLVLPAGLAVAMTMHIVGAILLVGSLLYAKPIQRLLTRRSMVYLGDLSFGLYLTHIFILGTFASYLFVHFSSLSYGVRFLVTIVPALLLMLGVAHLFTKYVDQQAIRLSQWIYEHRTRRVG